MLSLFLSDASYISLPKLLFISGNSSNKFTLQLTTILIPPPLCFVKNSSIDFNSSPGFVFSLIPSINIIKGSDCLNLNSFDFEKSKPSSRLNIFLISFSILLLLNLTARIKTLDIFL